ncbi:hypothetical protein PV328_012239 [Microctonus aethiopoides]|uniref:Uncharacterized protein n=1 Tax=Microctonus aethiopoides TaxID=144406 RepID=A0AA39C2J4_9HYME|nr:hypothetical protein PV328_012239 [Microctonus aethiopoides]
MKNCRSVSKTSFEQQWGNPFVLQLSKSKYSKRKQCGSLFPQKINIDEEEGVHDFLIDDLRNINCAAREVLHFKSRDREEIERRALKAIEEMRRASEKQICIEKCAGVFIGAFCNYSQYGTMFYLD